MSRYDWLRQELERIPRRKFHVVEPKSLVALGEIERRYGRLPEDYRDFAQEFGPARFFRSPFGPGHLLSVEVPPVVLAPAPHRHYRGKPVARLDVGYYINTGSACLEWTDGSFLHEGGVLFGLTGQRPRLAGSFEQWLKQSFTDARKLYKSEDWAMILQPAAPFTAREQQIVEALPLFVVRKAGVTAEGKVRIEILNQSPLELRCLTVGVRSMTGMVGGATLPVSGIGPGTSRTIAAYLYRGAMDPEGLTLFRLPPPDPEDRPYYPELAPSDAEVSILRADDVASPSI